MKTIDICILVLYSLGMSVGQVLFKFAAERTSIDSASSFVRSLLSSGYLYAAIALYGVLSFVWVWILGRVPLSRAYPFVVLAFVITPGFGVLLFRESVNLAYLASLALILCGLALLIAKGSS